MDVLVTGASGFLGQHILATLNKNKNIKLTAVLRKPFSFPMPFRVERRDIHGQTNWNGVINAGTTIIHAAASTTDVVPKKRLIETNIYKTNVSGTVRLGEQAAKLGAKRFIFISSAKVHGENTIDNAFFSEKSEFNPQNYYGETKAIAEERLRRIFQESKVELVILRPAAIYGENMKNNLMMLSKLISVGVPLPFKSVRNKRSFISIENLVNLIEVCLELEMASNEAFMASDGSDLSTPELIFHIAEALNQSPRLLAVPEGLLREIFSLFARGKLNESLLGSLRLDISKARGVLGWHPPVRPAEGFKQALKFLRD